MLELALSPNTQGSNFYVVPINVIGHHIWPFANIFQLLWIWWQFDEVGLKAKDEKKWWKWHTVYEIKRDKSKTKDNIRQWNKNKNMDGKWIIKTESKKQVCPQGKKSEITLCSNYGLIRASVHKKSILPPKLIYCFSEWRTSCSFANSSTRPTTSKCAKLLREWRLQHQLERHFEHGQSSIYPSSILFWTMSLQLKYIW